MSTRSVYIPLHGDVFTNRKTIAAANELTKGDVEKIVGHLARLWAWALERNDDGDLSHLNDQMVADAAGWRGRASRFVEAITRAGFLDADRHLHDWDDYAGTLVERRERDKERKRREREEARVTGTFPASSGGRPKDSPSPVRTQPTRPERNEPERNEGADSDAASGQVSASAPSPSGPRGARTPRLDETQILTHCHDLLESQGWPLGLPETRHVLANLASDATLPDGDLDFALGTYRLRLDDSPLMARTSRAVEKALHAWLTSHLRRDRLATLVHEKRGSNEVLYEQLGTNQYSEMSDDEIEVAIAALDG